MPREEEKLRLGKGAAFVKGRLKRLRQEEETWEADFQALPRLIHSGGMKSCLTDSVAMTQQGLIKALVTAYNYGVNATKAVHFGRKGFTKTVEAREQAALNRILRRHTGAALTDEEYKSFNA